MIKITLPIQLIFEVVDGIITNWQGIKSLSLSGHLVSDITINELGWPYPVILIILKSLIYLYI